MIGLFASGYDHSLKLPVRSFEAKRTLFNVPLMPSTLMNGFRSEVAQDGE